MAGSYTDVFKKPREVQIDGWADERLWIRSHLRPADEKMNDQKVA